jgi:hypothetical protein
MENYYKPIQIVFLVSQDISEVKLKECIENSFCIEAEGKTSTGITQWQLSETRYIGIGADTETGKPLPNIKLCSPIDKTT